MEKFGHGLLERADQAFAIAQLPALQRFGQTRGYFLCCLHADVRHQQLIFELLKQLIVDLFLAEQ